MGKQDITSQQDIEHLVDQFYKKVITDPIIGFIFTEVVQLSWEKHIPTMYAFWGSVLLGNKSYSGNPMMTHKLLNEKVSLTKEHFDRWLSLWQTTINENFYGQKADEAIQRAQNIASLMQFKIAQNSNV